MSERWTKWFLFPLGVIGLVVGLAQEDPVARETWRYTLQGLALAAVFVAAIRFPEWAPFRPLNWRPIRFVGTLTYSLYLIHDLVLESLAVRLHLGSLLCAAIGLLLTFSYAWLSYTWMERPLGRLRQRLGSSPQASI